MTDPQEKLSAWLDDELNDVDRAKMDECIAGSNDLQQQVNVMRAIGETLRAADRPQLLPLQRERFYSVVTVIRERAMLQTSLAAAAIAAMVLVSTMIGLNFFHGHDSPSVGGEDWTIVLSGSGEINGEISDPTESLLRQLAEQPQGTP